MKKQYLITIEGKTQTWAFMQRMTEEDAADLSRDGVEVGLIIAAIPWLIAELGLAKPYLFAVDVFNFRDPF